ncbi:MAG: hypothetical protein QM723_09505 [Myxococcaceae bacterium]
MHKGFALVVGLSLGAVFAVACGSKPVCSSSNCMGCCDAAGECQLGATAQQCGRGGFACQACALAQACVSGFCATLNNAGGGSASGGGFSSGGGSATGGGGFGTGGGSATGGGFSSGGGSAVGGGSGVGGGTPSCAPMPSFNSVRSVGTTLSGFGTIAVDYNAFSEPYDLFGLEAIESHGGTVPGTHDLSQGIGFGNCAYCVVYGQGCHTDGGCAHGYLGTQGTATVTQVTGDQDAGSVSAIFSGVVLTEWSFNTDLPVNGGQCFNVPNQSFFVSWP